jgi:hypothetical protein
MTTKAMPLSAGMCSKNDLSACSPPAEAPIPTTANGRVLGVNSLRCGALGERFAEDFIHMALKGFDNGLPTPIQTG